MHGSDGTDEITVTGVTWLAALEEDGSLREAELHPEDFGLPVHPFEAIRGGTPAENAAALGALLDGATGAYRDAVLMNAAAALTVAGRTEDLREGVALAADSIDSGAARGKLSALAKHTSEVSS